MKVKKALHKIQEILAMKKDSYGDPIHPGQQISYIKIVMEKLENKKA